ncbi:GerMN domain-containing protein [Streptomyces niveus]|uniref:GerMN domain-containing protein n=1 Tax=Streptomyces niveus TaxID=193462 RepID=UPI0037A000BE
MRRRAGALTVTAAALLCLSSGCGVPPSGVVEVGEPATGMTLSKAVYFLDAESSLHAVARPEIPDTNPVAAAVRELLAGPTPTESEYLTTALPPDLPQPEITVGATTILIRFPTGTPRLTPAALHQLTCTTTLATHPTRPRPAPPSGAAAPQQTPPTIHITIPNTPPHPTPTPPTCP